MRYIGPLEHVVRVVDGRVVQAWAHRVPPSPDGLSNGSLFDCSSWR